MPRRPAIDDYIPELSEVRMVQRAPDYPIVFPAEDGAYVEACLREVEAAYGFEAFPGAAFDQIPAKGLIELFIQVWRGTTPKTTAQQEAYGKLPGAIRLMDTLATFLEERGPTQSPVD